jgi:NAD(P)-dependent dehydrogenase (short-subunit alcohol dehydrogenase family)
VSPGSESWNEVSQSFSGRVAVVTGGASGLGRCVSLELARRGAAVAVLDLNGPGAADVAAEIAAAGGTALGLACDVADASSVDAVIEECATRLGHPHLACNCAAVQHFFHTHEVTAADWTRIIEVNLGGTFRICQAVIRHCLADDAPGAIVNVASTAGLFGLPYDAPYCASKGGVIQLTRSLAVEYSNRRIRVNAVVPGGMDTPMLGQPFPDDTDPAVMAHIQRSLLGVIDPAQVASFAGFMLSDAASSMTGSIVPFDGGSLA